MHIQGEMTIEGVRLVVDIEAPDDDREIFVTNLGPSFITIPKQRWPLEYLDLADETREALRQAGVRTLADVIDRSWQLSLPQGLDGYHDEVWSALESLRSIALTFEALPDDVAEPGLEPFPIGEEIAKVKAPPSRLSLDTQLASIGVPQSICIKLQKARNTTSIRELLRLGRRKLVMTAGIVVSDVDTIDQKFKGAGVWWNTPLDDGTSPATGKE
ncbi:MAG: hypothetical protein HY984_00685 [Candidatus Magasanikbacteria bacterium]|nr:hypothetical protein [Candidatus Magasanikbacteria bacterium]